MNIIGARASSNYDDSIDSTKVKSNANSSNLKTWLRAYEVYLNVLQVLVTLDKLISKIIFF